MDMICISYECEERGVFTSNGIPWPDEDIAAAVGGDIAENLRALAELLAKDVCSRNQSGAVFCRRVVRDEQIRKVRAQAGKLGGNPVLLKQNPNLSLTTQVNLPPSKHSDYVSEVLSGKEEGSGEKPPPEPSRRDLAAKRASAIVASLNGFYRRKPTNHWSYLEQTLLCEVSRRDDVLSELAELLEFAKSPDSFFPQSTTSLLEGWTTVLDRARRAADGAAAKPKTIAEKNVSERLAKAQRLLGKDENRCQ